MDHRAHVKELRNFGLIVGGVFSVIGLWPMVWRGEPVRLWALIIGGLLIGMGSVVPTWLAPINRGWMWIGHVLGWINTRIILGVGCSSGSSKSGRPKARRKMKNANLETNAGPSRL